jgi:hypothetical protein
LSSKARVLSCGLAIVGPRWLAALLDSAIAFHVMQDALA